MGSESQRRQERPDLPAGVTVEQCYLRKASDLYTFKRHIL